MVYVNRLSNELWNCLGDISLCMGEFVDVVEVFSRVILFFDFNGGEDVRMWSNFGSVFYSFYVEWVKELR